MPWTTDPAPSLHYVVRDSGPLTLVFLHELGGSAATWGPVTEALRGRRLIAVDQRGAGESEKVRAPFGPGEHVNDLERVLAAAGVEGPISLVGVAAGCAIAAGYALRHPERVNGILMAAPALDVSQSRRAYLAGRTERAAREGMRAIADDTLANSYPAQVRGAEFDAYRARFLANDPVSYGLLNLAFAETDWPLEQLATPCLLLHGAHDSLRPLGYVETVARRIPGARVETLDCAHIMPMQAPAALAQTIASFFG